jgi:hypothetical protein
MSNDQSRVSRRHFGAATGFALASPWAAATLGQSNQQRSAPSDRIRVGVIGLGSRGFNLLDELLKLDEVDVTVVCDVDRLHYRDNVWGKG